MDREWDVVIVSDNAAGGTLAKKMNMQGIFAKLIQHRSGPQCQEVYSIKRDKDYKFIVKSSNATYRSKVVILDVKKHSRRCEAKGFDHYRTDNVVWHENEIIKWPPLSEQIGVIGYGYYGVKRANDFRKRGYKVTLFTDRYANQEPEDYEALGLDENVTVVSGKIQEFCGKGRRLEGILVKDRKYPVNKIMFSKGISDTIDFGYLLKLKIKDHCILVDENNMSDCRGFYVFGDFAKRAKSQTDTSVNLEKIIENIKEYLKQ